MQIRWLKSAIDTRFAQLDYIARDNPGAAERLDDAIERQTGRLGDHPYMGREGRVSGTRELVIMRTPFIVVYRVTAARVEILRILHGAQQWPRPETGA
jgi:toxin ParE1/3/4